MFTWGLPRAVALLESFPGTGHHHHWAMAWMYRGCTHVALGDQEQCGGSSSARLLPARARQHLGGKGREISHRKALCPWKGYSHSACSCQYAEPGSQSQAPDFTGSQICHQPVHQHKPRWQSSGGFCSPPCHLALGTVGSPTSYCSQSGGLGTCKPPLQTPAPCPLE